MNNFEKIFKGFLFCVLNVLRAKKISTNETDLVSSLANNSSISAKLHIFEECHISCSTSGEAKIQLKGLFVQRCMASLIPNTGKQFFYSSNVEMHCMYKTTSNISQKIYESGM